MFLSMTPCLPTVASEPHLSLHVTEDLTFNCTVAGFSGTFHSLHSLKIIQRNVPREVSVLATVSGGSGPTTSATFQSNHPNFDVPWHVSSVYARDSWLGLTIINVDSRHSGVYACQINYFENAGDRLSTWESSNLSVAMAEEDSLNERVPGFSVQSQRGVQAACQLDLDASDITSMAISSQDEQRWASHSSDGSASEGLVAVTFRPENSMLEAHMVDVRCGDSAQFHCTVNTTSSGRLESSPQRLPADGCPTVRPSTTPRQTLLAGAEGTEPGPGGDGSTTEHSQQDDQLALKIGIPITVILVVAVLCVIIFFVWRRRKRKGSTDSNQPIHAKTNGEGEANWETNLSIKKRSKEDSTDSQIYTHEDNGGHHTNPTTSTRGNGDNDDGAVDVTRALAVHLRDQQHNIGGGRPRDEKDYAYVRLPDDAGSDGSARSSTSSDSYHSVQEGEHREGCSSRESVQTPAGGHMPQQVVDLRSPSIEV